MEEVEKLDAIPCEIPAEGKEATSRLEGGRPGQGHHKPRFEGRCEELKGHVFDCSSNQQVEKFSITIKEIAEHVGTTYKYGSDIRFVIENLRWPVISMPMDPPENAPRNAEEIWEKEVDEYVQREAALEQNIMMAYWLIWDRCTTFMRAKIEALPEYEEINATCDTIGLIKAIKGVTVKFDEQRYQIQGLYEAQRRFYLFSQGREMTNAAYLTKFKKLVSVVERCGGSLGVDTGQIQARVEIEEPGLTIESATTAEIQTAKEVAREKYLACALILSADRNRYGKLVEDLENDFIKGVDNYPKTLAKAYNLLENYSDNPRNILCASFENARR